MRKGQGSLETLLIIAAVLVIAVAVVLTANYMLGAPSESTSVIDDKFAASLKGAELIGYEKPFDGTAANAPDAIVINRKVNCGVEVVGRDELAAIDNLEYLTSLDGEDGTYPVYLGGSGGGSGGGRIAYIPSTPNEVDSDGDGINDGDEVLGCVNDPDPNCGIPTGYADLSADSVVAAATYDSSLTLSTIPTGATVELRATISNKGTENASGFTVKFYKKDIVSTNPVNPQTALAALPGPTVSPPIEEGFIGSVDVAGLEAGKTLVISIPFAATVEENKDFVIIVDSNNEVPEKELENNALLQEYTVAYVQPDAHLASNDIAIGFDNIHKGDTVSLSATISNSGGEISNMPVEFFLKDYVKLSKASITGFATMPITALASLPSSCPANINYVCGTDDKTYNNGCYASQAGAAIGYKGECNEGWHYIGKDTISMDPASQATAELSWTASPKGNYTLMVWANPMGTVEESSVDNNGAESEPFEIQESYNINPPHDNIVD